MINSTLKWHDAICLSVCVGLIVIGGCSGDAPTPAAEPKLDKPQTDKPSKSGDHKHTNRLAKETSPYLLLHAHNPVDWCPWGEEALTKAKKEEKIIFLSIGYSSCHWCHVMERESFLDEEIAKFLNEHFVCIKVDREERPDVDAIYMSALNVYNQLAQTGRGGGWPLSMFLTPDAKPFFGGTYFPARDGDRGAATGFLTLIQKVNEAWSKNPEQIGKDADTITSVTKEQLEGARPDPLFKIDKKLLASGLESLETQYDETYGGFGFSPRNPMRPKFPEPSNLFFLIDRIKKTKNERAKEMLVGTLQRMSMGGIRDHLGGGFHRYSVDRFWHIPHFEKMLYDNGQLASVYSEAYVLTQREDFRRIVDEMLAFVLQEMRNEDGGFYSALDAESENEEGKFYRWEKAEVEKLLSDKEFELFAKVYGLNGSPNFEEDYYAPQLERPMHEIARALDQSESDLEDRLTPIRKKLFDARAERERPLTDTKILTAWNGLMIRGFADAGRLFENDSYVTVATQSAEFVLDNMRDKEGRLLRTYGQGKAKLNAYADDYAFFIDGLVALYRATNEKKWLTLAEELMDDQIEQFWDDDGGGFFFTSNDHESLLARAKDPYDSAIPSALSVSTQNLVFLANELERPAYLVKAKRTVLSLAMLLSRAPAAAPRMLTAISAYLETQKDEQK